MPDEEVQMYTRYRGDQPVAYRYGPPWMAARLWIDGGYPTRAEAMAAWEREKGGSMIKDSGERTQFPSGAVRDMHGENKGRFDLLPMCVLMRLAKHYEAGAEKYQERNWEKGIPCHSFADSALRHIVKYMDGWRDEDHLIAAIWNLCGLAWTEEKKPELMDIPARLAFMKQEEAE